MKKLISIALVSLSMALSVHAQVEDVYVRQYHQIHNMVVGTANAQSGAIQPITINAAQNITNQLVSSAALSNGRTPPGTGLAWPIKGSMFIAGAPTNFVLQSTITGSAATNSGWSVKVLQGTPDDGLTWNTVTTVSNAVPTATNTYETNLLIPTSLFYGYTYGRVYTITNTSAQGTATTNNIQESDQILGYH